MSVFKKCIAKASGNRVVQKLLSKNVLTSQYYMGVGSGDEVDSSGEEVMFEVMENRGPGGYCIFDVGANQGQFLKLAKENISSEKFSIHCFEPGRETYEMLVKNSKDDPRVTLNNIGLGKEKGELVLYYNTPGSGIASLTKRRLDHFGLEFDQDETVVIDTVDGYCAQHGIDRIHLLKADVEGHELDVFAGAKEMFEKKAIDMVSFEFGGCNIDTRTFLQDFWYFFIEQKMKMFRITPAGYLVPIKKYKEADEQFKTTNFIAIAE